MTPEQQAIVQTTFAKVTPIADTAATLFYDDLFQRNPRLRSLFKEDMTEQRQKLMTMLGTVVANLRQWDRIAPAARALGQRHVGYGVVLEDYDTVGAALIATLEKGLGDEFTPKVREAWTACYAAIVEEMLSATTASRSWVLAGPLRKAGRGLLSGGLQQIADHGRQTARSIDPALALLRRTIQANTQA